MISMDCQSLASETESTSAGKGAGKPSTFAEADLLGKADSLNRVVG
jgi:hypothetical protein